MKMKILSLLLALCLIAGLLPMAVFAADGDYITVRFDRNGTKMWNGKYTAGMNTMYAVTAEDGAISDGTADNWNIKLEYPAGGNPTLTLKGATIKYSADNDFPCMISGNADLTIKVEEDSSITGKGRTALYFSVTSMVTISGPGKLSVINDAGDSAGITFGGSTSFDAGKLVFKDANVEIKPNATSTTRFAIGFTNREGIVIDNSKINIISGTRCMGIVGLGNVKETDGKITSLSPYWTVKGNDIERNVVIQNGSVVTGNATVNREFIAVTGDIIIKDSTVEAESAGKIFNKAPVLEGEYTAVGSAKAGGTLVAYSANKATSYKYIKIVPGTVELIPTEPTTPPTEPVVTPTEPTTPPTEPVVTPTEPVVTPTTPTESATTPTTPAESDSTTTPTKAPAASKPDQVDDGEGMDGAMIALIAVGAVAALAGIALVLLWFVIKPKWLVK